MKYLKKFNEHKFDELSDLGEDIATDLLGRFQKMREEGKIVTVDDFDKYMSERGADSDLSHSVMNHLVNMGFDFDIEKEEDEEYPEPFLKENLSGKEIEVGKPYKEWTEAEKLQGLIDLAVDGFHLNLSHDKLERMSKEEIIDRCDSFYEWFLKLRSEKKGK